MKRSFPIWLGFAVCALAATGVLGWFTSEMLRLERETTRTRRLATVEENIRLSLWRMDSALAAVHGLEAARPWQDYQSLHPVDTVFADNLAPLPSRSVLVPSPLLALNPPYIRLHVQIDRDGSISSPQAPAGAMRDAALASGVAVERLADKESLLTEFRSRFDRAAFTAALNPPVEEREGVMQRITRRRYLPAEALDKAVANPADEEAADLDTVATAPADEQQIKSATELRQREEFYAQQNTLGLAGNRRDATDSAASAAESEPASSSFAAPISSARTRPQTAASTSAQRPSGVQAEAVVAVADQAGGDVPAAGEMPPQALWINGELFLVRRVAVPDREFIQAAWIDWDDLRAWLLSRVVDLLPNARLERAGNGGFPTIAESTRQLAFLPVRVIPGVVPVYDYEDLSFLHLTLGAAWFGALFALGALALLMAGTLRLSERRGAFVSAVTHELRTPLTTFRMYTEMLSGGMVTDEGKRRGYFDTLRKESDRLYHLVENVLTYSRIERGRARRQVEETTPSRLVARFEDRLRQRAQQSQLILTTEFAADAKDRLLRTDITAVEQVLFNLVDNAAKYAVRGDGAGQLRISVARDNRSGLCIRVADEGPGIDASARRRLFKPFSKSAAEAAHSKPGVGLGLALSRRLARDELGGELTLETTGPDGTTFCLRLPLN